MRLLSFDLFLLASLPAAMAWLRRGLLRFQFASLILIAVISLSPSDLFAQPFRLTRIADTSVIFQSIQTPSITNSGLVAFYAGVVGGGDGIYAGDGITTEVVVDDSGIFDRINPEFSINGYGDVAFIGRDRDSADGIYTIKDGTVGLVADDIGEMDLFRGVTINNTGKIAFVAQVAGRFGIFTGPDPIADRVTSNSAIALHPWYSFPEMNDLGTIVFRARVNRPSSFYGAFRGPNAQTDLITTMPGSANEDLAIGNDGRVLTLSRSEPGIESIVSYHHGSAEVVADTTGDFRVLRSPEINSRGAIAFQAQLDDHSSGIFTGPDAITDKVIRTGDYLFGGIVEHISFENGLNDSGQLAFNYRLTNGVVGVAIATPVPEPSQAVCSLLSLLGWWHCHVARKKCRKSISVV